MSVTTVLQQDPVSPTEDIDERARQTTTAVAAEAPVLSVGGSARSEADASTEQTLIVAKSVSVFYGAYEAVKGVSLKMPRNRVIAMIGPSGCGKSTFLRSIN